MYLWGRNNYAQLGDNSIIDRSSPVQIGSLTNWESVSISSSTGAAIKTDGTLWAWGGNSLGEVGDNTTVNRSSPVQVGSDTNWQLISFGLAASFHLGIKTDGTLWSWGSANRGQLGNNSSTVNISSPTQIGSETSWRKVTVARRSSMASESS
jgi:alpha-tubulin suppressor-like RCC1 family protein